MRVYSLNDYWRWFRLTSMQSRRWIIVNLLITLAGCESVPERQPLPPEYTKKAGIPGVPEARTWADEWPTWSKDNFMTVTDADIRENYFGIYAKPHNYLAISGGGRTGLSEQGC